MPQATVHESFGRYWAWNIKLESRLPPIATRITIPGSARSATWPRRFHRETLRASFAAEAHLFWTN